MIKFLPNIACYLLVISAVRRGAKRKRRAGFNRKKEAFDRSDPIGNKGMNYIAVMKTRLNHWIQNRYFWMEIIMLSSITFFLSVISDVEYSIYEEGNGWLFINSMEYRLVFGFFSFMLYGGYYWGVLKPLVNRKKSFLLFVSVIAFIPFTFYYDHYVTEWTVMRLPFVSDEVHMLATRQYKSKGTINFVYAYRLSSRCVPLIFFAYLIRSLKQEAQLKSLKEQQLISELNYLRAQIQPHFFFNTLNNIYALALKNSADTAPVVLKLSEMMRHILYKSGDSKVPLGQEVEFISHYVGIERIRHRNNVAIVFDVQGKTAGPTIEPLLLLPFVENAFKHGARESLTPAEVSIVIFVQGNEMNMQIRNTKPMLPKQEESTKGIGLENVRKRLGLLYHDKHLLNIVEDDQQYQVNLIIELE